MVGAETFCWGNNRDVVVSGSAKASANGVKIGGFENDGWGER
jgi:hypothetical protein